MSRRGRTEAPPDEQLLAARGRLVEVEGVVKANERLGVSYRTAANCHESRRLSAGLIMEEAGPGEEQVHGAVADCGVNGLVDALQQVLDVVAASNRRAGIV